MDEEDNDDVVEDVYVGSQSSSQVQSYFNKEVYETEEEDDEEKEEEEIDVDEKEKNHQQQQPTSSNNNFCRQFIDIQISVYIDIFVYFITFMQDKI